MNIEEITKDIDMNKVYDDICKKNGITREQWDKMEEWQKLSIIAPNGLWNSFDFDNEEQEEE